MALGCIMIVRGGRLTGLERINMKCGGGKACLVVWQALQHILTAFAVSRGRTAGYEISACRAKHGIGGWQADGPLTIRQGSGHGLTWLAVLTTLQGQCCRRQDLGLPS